MARCSNRYFRPKDHRTKNRSTAKANNHGGPMGTPERAMSRPTRKGNSKRSMGALISADQAPVSRPSHRPPTMAENYSWAG